MYEKQKAEFIKVYANLPIGLRSEPVVVIDEVGPLSWNAVYAEVVNDTNLSKTLLKKLEEMEII